MTPDKQTQDKKEQQKKKIMIGVVVVIVLIILWQLIGGGGGGGGAPTTPVASAPNKPGVPGKPASGTMNAGGPAVPAAPAPQPEMATPKETKVSLNPEIAKMQAQAETDYVTSLNKLQMLKLQKEIDETKTAIATAELNRMTAEKNIADMVTSTQNITPTMPAPPPQAPQAAAPVPPPQPVHMMPAGKPEVAYTVMSVTYEGGKWSAVLGDHDKLYTVSVGDNLQPDDSVVTSIDRQGVVLRKENKTRTLSINTSNF